MKAYVRENPPPKIALQGSGNPPSYLKFLVIKGKMPQACSDASSRRPIPTCWGWCPWVQTSIQLPWHPGPCEVIMAKFMKTTLPETNSSHLKIGFPKIKVIFQTHQFSGAMNMLVVGSEVPHEFTWQEKRREYRTKTTQIFGFNMLNFWVGNLARVENSRKINVF